VKVQSVSGIVPRIAMILPRNPAKIPGIPRNVVLRGKVTVWNTGTGAKTFLEMAENTFEPHK
jgi:hypothetical protein